MGLDTAMNITIPLKEKVEIIERDEMVLVDEVGLQILYFRKCFSLANKLGDYCIGIDNPNKTKGFDTDWNFGFEEEYLEGIEEILNDEIENTLNGRDYDAVWERGSYLNILYRNLRSIKALIAFKCGKISFNDVIECSTDDGELFKQIEDSDIDMDNIYCNFYNSY